ncbi:MAG TPA: hypothetical protein VMM12_04710 [Longimicrobiales bacterium]|nr:hypothetical protein [Longimicrobiales bacterium]
MSLVSFHRALILTAIVFCLGFAGWELQAYRTAGDSGALLLSAVFGLLGIGLSVYLARLAAFLKLDD